VDYELLGIRLQAATSYDTALVYLRFKNVGSLEGSALAELYVNDVWQAWKSVTDLVGDGQGKDSLSITYGAPGNYVIEVRLTSDTGTDSLTITKSIR
jgi:hypothetical protein